MRTFVKNYVKGCAECQQFKINRHPTKVTLLPIPGPSSDRPFAQCSMDLITDLPLSNGFDSILSIVDHGLTKGVILTPCNKTITSEQVADILIGKLYSRFGLPDKIISDRGPQFAAKGFRALLDKLKIESSLSTAYHPQTDGTTERFNQEIEAYLAIYCSLHPEDWADSIPILEFTHNNRRHADRTQSPFELIMGLNPIAIPTAFESSIFPSVDDRLRYLEKTRQEALAAHELGRNRMIDRTKRQEQSFKKGQMVWLEAKNLRLPYRSKKMAPKREGPFEITEVIGPLSYRLKLPEQWKLHDVFHATLLSPYTETEVHGPNHMKPTPDLVEGEEEYEVEAIIAHRKRGTGYQYLVKWKGYPTSDNSWEPARHLTNALEILEEYKQRQNI